MTIRADIRHCKKCGNIWSWNPDVGNFKCPYCTKKEMEQVKGLAGIIGLDKDNKKKKD